MIYWFTGQPAHGKTILAKKLSYWLTENKHTLPFMIDGDDMRELFSNKDYSIKGRVENVGTAQRIAHYLHNQGKDVIVALIAPYIDQREDFKTLLSGNVTEIYVHTGETRERDHFKAIAYVAPSNNFIDIDTTIDTPDESFQKIINTLPKKYPEGSLLNELPPSDYQLDN
jgi:adenylylsulfate kinase-like enzyme|tara:strand:- start:918 stop:1427 length:510 start_codon:yes stop_codon:yes gene_type:complete